MTRIKEILNKLTWRKKLQILFSGTIVFWAIVYLLSLSNTIEIYKQLEFLKLKVASIEHAATQISRLEKRVTQINQMFNISLLNNTNSQDVVLEKVIKNADISSVLLKEFPTPLVTANPDCDVYTYVITCEGKYVNLLKFINFFEINSIYGHVISSSLYVVRDFSTKTSKLQAKVYLQKYIKK